MALTLGCFAFILLGLLVIGLFTESAAAITIVVPVLMPLVYERGTAPGRFGIMVVFNLFLGLLTPPVGSALFVVDRTADISIDLLVKEVLPFFIPLLGSLIIIICVPGNNMIAGFINGEIGSGLASGRRNYEIER